MNLYQWSWIIAAGTEQHQLLNATYTHNSSHTQTHTIDSLKITECIHKIHANIEWHCRTLLVTIYLFECQILFFASFITYELKYIAWILLIFLLATAFNATQFVSQTMWQYNNNKNNSYNLQLIDVEWLQSIPLVFIN